MKIRVQVDPAVYFVAAMFLLVIPVKWVLAAIGAAVFHECCHICMIWFFRGKVTNIRLGVGGAEIRANLPGRMEDAFCALAGPAGSFLLLVLCHIFPKVAICAFVQGIFNLIPVYPLDGGRFCVCLLERFFPDIAEKMQLWIENVVYGLVIGLGFAGTFLYDLGSFPAFFSALVIIKVILRKRPCKERKIRVQ